MGAGEFSACLNEIIDAENAANLQSLLDRFDKPEGDEPPG